MFYTLHAICCLKSFSLTIYISLCPKLNIHLFLTNILRSGFRTCKRSENTKSENGFPVLFLYNPMHTPPQKGIQEQISDQRWNLFLDFAFDCKSKIQSLKSKSRFPNRARAVRLDEGTVKANKCTIRAWSMHHQCNSGAPIGFLCTIFVQAQCTMTNFHLFCYGCDHCRK